MPSIPEYAGALGGAKLGVIRYRACRETVCRWLQHDAAQLQPNSEPTRGTTSQDSGVYSGRMRSTRATTSRNRIIASSFCDRILPVSPGADALSSTCELDAVVDAQSRRHSNLCDPFKQGPGRARGQNPAPLMRRTRQVPGCENQVWGRKPPEHAAVHAVAALGVD